jgi:hypothetical protein
VAQRRQRVAQLVRNRCQELVLAAIELAQLRFRVAKAQHRARRRNEHRRLDRVREKRVGAAFECAHPVLGGFEGSRRLDDGERA